MYTLNYEKKDVQWVKCLKCVHWIKENKCVH